MVYDAVMLGVLALAVARGAAKGLVWQLATIAALVLCFAFSESLSLAVAPLIAVKPPLNRWIAMFALYLGFSFVSFAAARSLRDWIEKAKFVEYDRHLGGVFGLLKGAVFCLFVTFFVVTLSESARAYIFNSYSGYAAAVVMDQLHPVMPDGLHDVLEPYIHRLDRPGINRHVADGHDHDDHQGHEHRGREPEPAAAPNVMAPVPDGAAPARPADGPRPFEPDELARHLPALLDTAIRRISLEWGSGPDAESRMERAGLLREIAAVYSDFPGAREALIEELEAALAGLPERVSLAVIHDWHADLLAVDRTSDPDPATDLSMPLDRRIVRQLQLAGIPLTALPEELRRRLDGEARR